MKTSEQKTVSPRTKTCSALLQTAATGELEGGYRRIVQGLQGNPFGPTVKSLPPTGESAGGDCANFMIIRHCIREYYNNPAFQSMKNIIIRYWTPVAGMI